MGAGKSANTQTHENTQTKCPQTVGHRDGQTHTHTHTHTVLKNETKIYKSKSQSKVHTPRHNKCIGTAIVINKADEQNVQKTLRK